MDFNYNIQNDSNSSSNTEAQASSSTFNSSYTSSYESSYDNDSSGSNGFAITALILGIVSIFCTCCCCCLYLITPVLSIIGIVMAFLSRRNSEDQSFSKMALAGLILSIVGLVLFLIVIIFEIVLWTSGMAETILEESFGPAFESEFGYPYDNYNDPYNYYNHES